jgi:hypothetical protein
LRHGITQPRLSQPPDGQRVPTGSKQRVNGDEFTPIFSVFSLDIRSHIPRKRMKSM